MKILRVFLFVGLAISTYVCASSTTDLFLAVEAGSLSRVRDALDRGADVTADISYDVSRVINPPFGRSSTFIMCTVLEVLAFNFGAESFEIGDLLLQRGAATQFAVDGKRILRNAILCVCLDAVKFFLDNGVIPEPDHLYSAVQRVWQPLLYPGVGPVVDRLEKSKEALAICELFLKAGVSPNHRESNGATFLHSKVEQIPFSWDTACDLIAMFLRYGFNPNLKNNSNETFLHSFAFTHSSGRAKDTYRIVMGRLLNILYDYRQFNIELPVDPSDRCRFFTPEMIEKIEGHNRSRELRSIFVAECVKSSRR